MKHLIFILTLICFHPMTQAKLIPIHLRKSNAGDDIKKTLILSPQRHLTIDLRENPRHATRNILKLEISCGSSGTKHSVQVFEYVCGLMGLEYDESTDSVKLHLTKPNYTSVAGDCSGAEYTKKVSLKGFCPRDHTQGEDDTILPAPASN